MNLRAYITDYPDFPKQGITFKDISPLLASHKATQYALDLIKEQLHSTTIDKVVGIESRGFLLGTLLAHQLKTGFVPIRKPGKLPGMLYKKTYDLEYGTDSIEMQKNAIQPGDHILLHDDVLATGGTAAAACELIEQAGGKIVLCSFIMELEFLKGRAKLNSQKTHSLLQY